jgi:AAA+ superfamily predicted ATPase
LCFFNIKLLENQKDVKMFRAVDFGRSINPAFLAKTPSIPDKLQGIIHDCLPSLNASNHFRSLLSYAFLAVHSKDLLQECADLIFGEKDWDTLKPKMRQTAGAVCRLVLSIEYPYFYLICSEINELLIRLQQSTQAKDVLSSIASPLIQLVYLFSLLKESPQWQMALRNLSQPNAPDWFVTQGILEVIGTIPLLLRNIQDAKQLLVVVGRILQAGRTIYANCFINTLGSAEWPHVLFLAQTDFSRQGLDLVTQTLKLITTMVPIIIIAALFLLSRNASNPSHEKNYHVGTLGTPVRMDDVVGCEGAKLSILKVIDQLKNPGNHTCLGPAKPPKGILFFGPPGTGKSMLAKAFATAMEDTVFLSQEGSAFVNVFVGKGAHNVRALFEQAKKAAQENSQRLVIVFIDEINAIAGKRNIGASSGGIETNTTTEAFLYALDHTLSNVVVIGATNARPYQLDSAFIRSGRFDQHIEFQLPALHERVNILAKLRSTYKLASDADQAYWLTLAQATDGWCYADFTNLMAQAAQEAGSQKLQTISKEIYDQTFRKLQAQKARA